VSVFWELSVYVDQQMLRDENWVNTAEGRLALRLIRQENERLKMAAQQTREGSE
jgi:hypothetical protein